MDIPINSFPIDSVLPAVAASLAANRAVVLQAPPGSGKTTRVAPYLLDAPWLRGRKILMLEPRRLAARGAAAYMARQRGEAVGETVGYHIRLDRQCTAATRIEILTEGLLTQRLLSDPELADTGLVIFDEFHERSLAADTGLALALDVHNALRPDLRIVIMSATLQPDPIAAHLGNADIHTAHARMFPVETRLLNRLPTAPLPATAANAVLRALAEEDGSILVFLPGEGEIRRTLERLRVAPLPPRVTLHPLYAALSRDEQDAAVLPPAPGARKVVLATSIAESSITIEGIRVVIDTGWMRVPRFSPRHGMSRLETLRITRDRADQRRGRAGRLCPGVCYRLWDDATDQQLAPEALPEILDADLAPTVLQSAEWGAPARDGLPWLTPPPDAAWRHATALLQDLGALTQGGAGIPARVDSGRQECLPSSPPTITPRGRKMAQLPIHPRLAHMVFEAAAIGCAQRACLLAAALTEASSDSTKRYETDARKLLDGLAARDGFSQRVRELARRWGRAYPADDSRPCPEGLMLAWAFPDRIARRRDASGAFLLRSGRGAIIDTADPLAREEWLVAAELQDGDTDAKIRLAAPLDRDDLDAHFSGEYETRTQTYWDKRTEAVVAVNRLCLGAITLREGGQAKPDPAAVRDALLDGIRQKGIAQLPWTPAAQALRDRVNFLRRTLGEPWPDLTDDALLATLPDWLGPHCDGLTRWAHVENLRLTDILLGLLDALNLPRRRLDELAPTHVQVPSGSNIQIRYGDAEPHADVRIQEVFGMTRTPKVAGGRVPIVMHLLSPAHRPVQVTKDLESFWATGYALVRKDLRGRYPKHYWPDDPHTATPTRRTKITL
ncbi:MAG: ATP-dependent helicase HrpB [Kiritimatiellaeota bacterium]|nr:ATP-dependent helicase HrpB [Kiritimatiellota bacterium]